MEEKTGSENQRNEIYSERVRAGKRTYFFDVKQTRSSDYYLTITESKRRPKDGKFVFEKHKIFLYREDFEKFLKALTNTTDHVVNVLMDGVEIEYPPKRSHDDQGNSGNSDANEQESVSETVEESKTGLDDELSWD